MKRFTKKIRKFLLLISFLCLSLGLSAQTIKSYAATGAYGTMGPQPTPNLAISITFYNGYLLLNGIEKFVYKATNYDGSMQYYPAVLGNPTLRTTGILVSKDFSYIRQFSESMMMGRRMELVYDFTYIGEGYEPAQNYMGISPIF